MLTRIHTKLHHPRSNTNIVRVLMLFSHEFRNEYVSRPNVEAQYQILNVYPVINCTVIHRRLMFSLFSIKRVPYNRAVCTGLVR